MSELLLAQMWGRIGGPQGWPIEEARAVLKGLDEAWARYEAELADYHPRARRTSA